MKFSTRNRWNKLRIYLVTVIVLIVGAIISVLAGATAGAVTATIVALLVAILYIAEVEDTIKADGLMQFW